MNSNEYRTPDISEFVQGFIHEVKVNGKWTEERYDRDVSKLVIQRALDAGRIRRSLAIDANNELADELIGAKTKDSWYKKAEEEAAKAMAEQSDRLMYPITPDECFPPSKLVPIEWVIRKFGHSLTSDQIQQLEDYELEGQGN